MNEIMTFGDYLCNVCINIMEEMSHMSGISYGTINVLLFIILGPLATLIFMINSFIQIVFKNDRSKGMRILNITLWIIGLIIVLSILLPIIYVFIFGKF